MISADDDSIYARVIDMTPEEAAPLEEWDGCVQWAGDPPTEDDATIIDWFWRECEPCSA